MLSKVEARTEQGVMLSLTLQDISNGYSVQNIEGLDPVPANIVSSTFAGLDGEQYQSSRREKRNIILTLGLEPAYSSMSVRELRNRLYGFFMPKRASSLRFFVDGAPTVDISGRVETFDCPMFVKEPKATISIICFNPDFYNANVVEVAGETTSSSSNMTLNYLGSVDSGVSIEISINRAIEGFTIYHTPSGEQPRAMEVSGSFLEGDVVRIVTSPGSKSATLTRGGVLSSILYAVSPYADWTRLQPGNNGFRIQLAGAAIPYVVRYTHKYGGL